RDGTDHQNEGNGNLFFDYDRLDTQIRAQCRDRTRNDEDQWGDEVEEQDHGQAFFDWEQLEQDEARERRRLTRRSTAGIKTDMDGFDVIVIRRSHAVRRRGRRVEWSGWTYIVQARRIGSRRRPRRVNIGLLRRLRVSSTRQQAEDDRRQGTTGLREMDDTTMKMLAPLVGGGSDPTVNYALSDDSDQANEFYLEGLEPGGSSDFGEMELSTEAVDGPVVDDNPVACSPTQPWYDEQFVNIGEEWQHRHITAVVMMPPGLRDGGVFSDLRVQPGCHVGELIERLRDANALVRSVPPAAVRLAWRGHVLRSWDRIEDCSDGRKVMLILCLDLGYVDDPKSYVDNGWNDVIPRSRSIRLLVESQTSGLVGGGAENPIVGLNKNDFDELLGALKDAGYGVQPMQLRMLTRDPMVRDKLLKRGNLTTKVSCALKEASRVKIDWGQRGAQMDPLRDAQSGLAQVRELLRDRFQWGKKKTAKFVQGRSAEQIDELMKVHTGKAKGTIDKLVLNWLKEEGLLENDMSATEVQQEARHGPPEHFGGDGGQPRPRQRESERQNVEYHLRPADWPCQLLKYAQITSESQGVAMVSVQEAMALFRSLRTVAGPLALVLPRNVEVDERITQEVEVPVQSKDGPILIRRAQLVQLGGATVEMRVKGIDITSAIPTPAPTALLVVTVVGRWAKKEVIEKFTQRPSDRALTGALTDLFEVRQGVVISAFSHRVSTGQGKESKSTVVEFLLRTSPSGAEALLVSSGLHGVFFRPFHTEEGLNARWTCVWLPAEVQYGEALALLKANSKNTLGLAYRKVGLGIRVAVDRYSELHELFVGSAPKPPMRCIVKGAPWSWTAEVLSEALRAAGWEDPERELRRSDWGAWMVRSATTVPEGLEVIQAPGCLLTVARLEQGRTRQEQNTTRQRRPPVQARPSREQYQRGDEHDGVVQDQGSVNTPRWGPRAPRSASADRDVAARSGPPPPRPGDEVLRRNRERVRRSMRRCYRRRSMP
ncbi:MAG: hypothetical protein GY722_03905, partial [bacterium]|nr:hypothetical protein [bacterium]